MWIEYQAVVPFGNVYLFDTEAGYQTLVSDGSPMNSYHITPNLQRNMTPKIDLMFSIPLYYTMQSSTYNNYEIRFSPAMRYTFTSGKRVESRSVLRYDYRCVKPETSAWETSNRIRLSLEFLVPINRKTYFEDKMLYGIADGEGFFVVDQNVKERYANIFKTRWGLGYRLNYKYRFEVSYQKQISRTTIDAPFDTEDNILRLRCMMYLK